VYFDAPSHRLIVVRNFQKLDLNKFLLVMIFGMMSSCSLITILIVWSVLI